MTEKAERKPNRLKNFDYSQNGAYFITICTKERAPILSRIMHTKPTTVGNAALGVPQVRLTQIGKIVDKHIQLINGIDNYVIMPNHIHLLIRKNGTPGAAFPTSVSEDIRAFKSVVTRKIGYPVFQKSFYDHIIRDDVDYMTKYQYIDENPIKWAEDKYYQSTSS